MSSITSHVATSDPDAVHARARAVRWGSRLFLATVGLTALVGMLHMPFSARFFGALLPGVCPVQHGTPAQIDRGHAIAAAAIRSSGAGAAPARPALGFQLEMTTPSDLSAWASSHGVSCKAISGNDNLQKCVNVPANAVGQDTSFGNVEEITFEFRASGVLTAVQTMRRGLTAPDAARIASGLERTTSTVLGEPTRSGGEPTSDHLGRSFLRTFVAEHEFTDYRAKISATNLAHTGVMVREEYISAI